MNRNDLKRICSEFYKEYFDIEYISAIGITNDEIIVYLKKKIVKYPIVNYKGVSVVYKFCGPLQLLSIPENDPFIETIEGESDQSVENIKRIMKDRLYKRKE